MLILQKFTEYDSKIKSATDTKAELESRKRKGRFTITAVECCPADLLGNVNSLNSTLNSHYTTSAAPPCSMASFITTMFVCAPFPNTPPTPLAPVFTLPQSASCVTFHAQSVSTPGSTKTLLCDLENGDSENPSLPQRLLSNARTRGQFKPRNANKGTSSYQLRQFAEATLGSGSLRKAVKLPEGEDLNEWLAVNGRHGRTRSSAKMASTGVMLI